MNHSRGFALLPVLISVVVILGLSGGAYFYTHPQKAPSFDFSLAPMASTTPVTIETSSAWKTYKSAVGFEIQYPQNWGVVHEESLSGSENAKRWFSVAFGAGTYGNRGYDGEWFVFVYNKSISNVEELIKDMGKQFSDRKEKRENITINGMSAVNVTVTSPSTPGWSYEQVFLETGNDIYVVSNGAVAVENSFATFYSSFKLVSSSKPVQITNDNGTLAAVPVSGTKWQFNVSGSFGTQQDSYYIDFGDDTKVDLNKCQNRSEDYVCAHYGPLEHVFARSGAYTVRVYTKWTGLATQNTKELLTLQVQVK